MVEEYFEAAQRLYKIIDKNRESPDDLKKALKEGYERIMKLARSKDFIMKAASKNE